MFAWKTKFYWFRTLFVYHCNQVNVQSMPKGHPETTERLSRYFIICLLFTGVKSRQTQYLFSLYIPNRLGYLFECLLWTKTGKKGLYFFMLAKNLNKICSTQLSYCAETWTRASHSIIAGKILSAYSAAIHRDIWLARWPCYFDHTLQTDFAREIFAHFLLRELFSLSHLFAKPVG